MKKIILLSMLTVATAFGQTIDVCKTSYNNQGDNWCDSIYDLESAWGADVDTIFIDQFDILEWTPSITWTWLKIAHESYTGSGMDAILNSDTSSTASFRFLKIGDTRVTINTQSSGTFMFVVNVSPSAYAGIIEKELTGFKVFPNPASDYISISEEGEVSVMDLSGSEVLKGDGKHLDIQALSPGIYIALVNGRTEKFVVR